MTPYHEMFLPIFLVGCAIASVTAFVAGRRTGCLGPLTLFVVGVMSLWAALFFGADLGYRAWQAMPNPPEEAFSDASVVGALVFGWFPSGIFWLFIFAVVRLIRLLSYQAKRRHEDRGTSNNHVAEETGNPYQGPSA